MVRRSKGKAVSVPNDDYLIRMTQKPAEPVVQSLEDQLEAIRDMTWKTFVLINDSQDLPSGIYGDLRVLSGELHDRACRALKRIRKR